MGMLLHKTLMEQAEKRTGKTTTLEAVTPKPDGKKKEDAAKKPTKQTKKKGE